MSANDWLEQGEKLVGEGRYTQAEEAFAKALQTPARATALNRYGAFAESSGHLEQAKSLFESVLEIDPTNPDPSKAEAYRNLGHIASVRGDLDDAERRYHSALEIDRKLNDAQG